MGVCHSKTGGDKKHSKRKDGDLNTDGATPGIGVGSDIAHTDTSYSSHQILRPLETKRGNRGEGGFVVSTERRELHGQFLDACFKGNRDKVEKLIRQNPDIGQDLSIMKGYKAEPLELGSGLIKTTYDVSEWNPLLLSISQRHLLTVKSFF
jgi:hypothetical protein